MSLATEMKSADGWTSGEGSKLTAVAQNATVSTRQGEAEKNPSSEGLEKYGGFTPTQVEALFSLFKERDNKEKMSGKWVGPV